MSEPLLQVRDLITAFDTDGGLIRAVDHVSFEVARGKTLGIVGESGCGKSVTAMSLIRLLPQPAGTILQGEVLFKGRHFDRQIVILCVRWYLSYLLSGRNLVEMMGESLAGPHDHSYDARHRRRSTRTPQV